MITSKSSLLALKAQADKIATKLKTLNRSLSKDKDILVFGIVMDDKFIKIELGWDIIDENSVESLSAWLLEYMRGKQNATN